MFFPLHIEHEGLDVLVIPNFIEGDRARLFTALLKRAAWHRPEMVLWGRRVKTARQVAWHADEGFVYRYSGQEHPWIPWTPELEDLRGAVSAHLGVRFNGVLLNHYANGQDYVSPHADDERDLAEGAPIACVSLGETRDFVLRHRDGRVFTVPLEMAALSSCLGGHSKWPRIRYQSAFGQRVRGFLPPFASASGSPK